MRNILRLSSKEIESVEVIHDPGAKYGAEVRSVLLIRTSKRQGDGLSGSFQVGARAAHSFQQSDNLALNYRKSGLDFFVSCAYDYARRYQKQRNETAILTREDAYSLLSEITILPVASSYTAEGGLNWEINKSHALGVRYAFRGMPRNRSDWATDEVVRRNGELSDNIAIHTRWQRRNLPVNTLNMYYMGNFDRWTLTLNNDYYSSRSKAEQAISETSMSEGVSAFRSSNKVSGDMLASKGVLGRSWGRHSLEGGYEYTYTRRSDLYVNHDGLLPDTDSRIKEQNSAVFVGATLRWGKYELSGGVRYEHTLSDYYRDGDLVAEQSRKYSRLFPNVSFSFPVERADLTLSYTAKTQRPLYSQLSGNIQYDDRFTYETGNPLLRPQTNHDIALTGICEWLFFTVGYQYVKDAILGVVEPYKEDEPINLMTYLNYDHLSRYSAVLSLSPKIRGWSPRLRLSLMGQGLETRVMGRAKRMNNPLLFVHFYNALSLGKGYTLTADLLYHTVGDMGTVTLKPSWQVNLGITKTVGRWYFQLNATDMLKTARNSMITYGSRMRLDKWNYSDSQALRLTIRYAFNTTKSKYKGRGAGQAERDRLASR